MVVVVVVVVVVIVKVVGLPSILLRCQLHGSRNNVIMALAARAFVMVTLSSHGGNAD